MTALIRVIVLYWGTRGILGCAAWSRWASIVDAALAWYGRETNMPSARDPLAARRVH